MRISYPHAVECPAVDFAGVVGSDTVASSAAACVSGVSGAAAGVGVMALKCRLLSSLSCSRKSAVSEPSSGCLSTTTRITRFLKTPSASISLEDSPPDSNLSTFCFQPSIVMERCPTVGAVRVKQSSKVRGHASGARRWPCPDSAAGGSICVPDPRQCNQGPRRRRQGAA